SYTNTSSIDDLVQASGYTREFIQERQLREGDLIFRDVNGDGIINDEDQLVLGSYLPSFTWGGNIGFRYKKFDFQALFQGQHGYHILNRKRGERIFTIETDIDTDIAPTRWRGGDTANAGPSASSRRRAWKQMLGSYFIEKGSYFR